MHLELQIRFVKKPIVKHHIELKFGFITRNNNQEIHYLEKILLYLLTLFFIIDRMFKD